MKVIFLLIAMINISYAEIIDTKSCKKFYDSNLSKKNYKLFSIYESKSLCGFVMNANTIGFDNKGVAKDQDLSSDEKKLLAYKGRWINIFSKDGLSDVTDKALADLGITEKFNCLSALPIKTYVQCPVAKKDIFEIIAKSKDENFINKTEI